MRVRRGTPMRRGIGDSAFCAPTFVGPLSPDQQATCANEQLQNIKSFYYQAGQDNTVQAQPSFLDTLPSWALPVGAVLLFLAVLPKGRR